MTLEEIRQEVQDASLVLVGLGEELKGDLTAFYRELVPLEKGEETEEMQETQTEEDVISEE